MPEKKQTALLPFAPIILSTCGSMEHLIFTDLSDERLQPLSPEVVHKLNADQGYEDISYFYERETNTAYVACESGRLEVNPSASYLFSDFAHLKDIEGLERLDMSQVTDMRGLFDGCESLESLDLSSWDVSHACNIGQMFRDCISLTELNISGWDTGSVFSMRSLFSDCAKLTKIKGIENLDTSCVQDMGYLFNGCRSLDGLDISKWDTSRVSDMRDMFNDCYALTGLDLSSWETSHVADMCRMFRNCQSLTDVSFLSWWNTESVTDMSRMFSGCETLEEIRLPGFDTSRVSKMNGMFSWCSALKTVDLSAASTALSPQMKDIFQCCDSVNLTGKALTGLTRASQSRPGIPSDV